MGKRQRIVLVALLVAVLGGFAWLVLSRTQPELVYQGKDLKFWLESCMDSRAGGLMQDEAKTAVREIGTNGLPLCLSWLSAEDSVPKQKLIQLARMLSVHWHTDSERRELAFNGLTVLGPIAAPAVPALVDLLNSADPDVQVGAARVLGSIGPAARNASPALVKSLQSTNAYVRLFATKTLGEIHTQPEVVVPALLQSLGNLNIHPSLFVFTTEALLKFRGPRSGIISVINPFLTNSWPQICTNATNTLLEIGSEDARAGVK